MLEFDAMSCGYGRFRAVHALSLTVEEGEVFGLIGANGAGKTSTLMAVAGHVALQGGSIRYRGQELGSLPLRHRVRAGIAVVPEGRRLFPDLSVADNLDVGAYARPAGRARSRERVLALFPRLSERLSQRAGSLSGGEQQMLAIGRALMAQPLLLLVDEASLGLMPKAADLCYAALKTLAREGLTILLVEQSTQRVLAFADRVCVLESGRAVWTGDSAQARRDPKLIDAYLGMRAADES